MMDRRAFVALVPACLLALPMRVTIGQPAQSYIPRIGFVIPNAPTWAEAKLNPLLQSFLAGMRDHGYEEGRDYVMETRSIQGNSARLPGAYADLVRVPVNVLLVNVCGAPINAARQATQTIPIVVATCNDDMVDLGIIKSMAHPGRNITGLSKLTPELAPKRLSLLKQTLPAITRVGVLWNPGYSAFTSDWRELRDAANHIGITLVPFEFRRADELEATFAAIRREHVDALMTFSDATVYFYAAQIAELTAAARIPTLFAFREVPDAGGLMSYGPNLADMWRRAADYVVRILKGAMPADLAIEQPTRFELVINLKTAKGLGITVPSPVLLQADDVIQ